MPEGTGAAEGMAVPEMSRDASRWHSTATGMSHEEQTGEAEARTHRSSMRMQVIRVQGESADTRSDTIAVEEPLEIQLVHGPRGKRTGHSISVTMRTPGHDADLAAGFLMTEGVVQDASDIERIPVAEPHGIRAEAAIAGSGRNTVCVELAPTVRVGLATLQRNFYTTSSCGICGKASLLALRSVCPPRSVNTLRVRAEVLYGLHEQLHAEQRVFAATGGLHACGLFDAEGKLLALREDVGRHNACDKLIGREFLADRTPLRNRMLLLSGRASFELLQKSVMAGIPLVASVGAPSSLAVDVAREFDVTLVGFLRDGSFNVYHGAERIAVPDGKVKK